MCAAVLAVALYLAAAPSVGGELITNGGMDPPFGDGMPRGWQKNCWGKNTVAFSPGEPHQGTSSLKVACTAFETGAVQFLCPLKVVGGRHCRISLWMRAQGGVGSVGVGLRERPEPYTMHLSAEFEPGEEWEQFTFEGTSDRSDERAGLFIWFAPDGPGTLWVDDVSVVEGGPRVLELPLPTGNVVPNASFEMALERDWRSRHVRPTLDETRPLHGGRSLRWDLDGQADQLVTRLIEFGGQGKPFTLELAARAEGSATIEASVWPAVMVGASGPLLRLEAVPKADWGVFRSTGPLPSNRNGSYFLTVDVRPKGKARVWLDAVRLAPGDGSDPFRCSKPIEASLACPKLAHIHREGEAVRLGRACKYARPT